MATGKTIPSGFCSDGLGEEEEELQEDRPTLAITIKKRMAFSLIIKSKRASVSSYHFLILSSEDEKHFILNQKKYRLGKKEKISTGKRKKLDDRRPCMSLLGFNLPIPLDLKTAKIREISVPQNISPNIS